MTAAVKGTVCGLVLAVFGFVGVCLVAFAFFTMAGISVPVSWADISIGYGAALLGSLMLLIGGVLLSINLRSHTASKIGLVGAALVTILVVGNIGSAILQAFRPSSSPAIDSAIHLSDLIISAILVVAVAIIDWVSYRAIRITKVRQ
jgi:hypothetical protein